MVGFLPSTIEMTQIARAKRIGAALFVADWRDALFVHFRVDPAELEARVPLELDLYNGCAYVSLVAFRQERLRAAIGVPEFLSRPLATHSFLNLRTYVVHEGEAGIYFLAEWIPNRLAVFLGPRLYGLPYRLAELEYETSAGCAVRRGKADGEFSCRAQWKAGEMPLPAQSGSETEFLIERYCAYTVRKGALRRFRIEHEPWRQVEAEVSIQCRDLLGDLLGDLPLAVPCSAQYSPGLKGVRISPPGRLGR